MTKLLTIVIVPLWLLAACASSSTKDLNSTFEVLGPQVAAPATVAPEYKIGPLDKLSIMVFQSKELTLPAVQVDANGQLLLPMVGVIRASGKTNTELSQEIADKLGACCLKEPDVAVLVTDAVSQQITVAGAVGKAGVYSLRGRTTLLQAVSMAGGADTQTANTKRIAVYRMVDGRRMGALFNLDAIRTGEAEDPEVYAGDTVIIDTSGAKSAWRTVVGAIPLFSIFRPF